MNDDDTKRIIRRIEDTVAAMSDADGNFEVLATVDKIVDATPDRQVRDLAKATLGVFLLEQFASQRAASFWEKP